MKTETDQAEDQTEDDGTAGGKETQPKVLVDDLIRVYKAGRIEVIALRGVNMQVAEGETVAIMGPSGCGKTTLLNLIGGLDRPTAGRVVVDGVAVNDLNDTQLVNYRREKVGFVFQFFNLVPSLTVRENIALPLTAAGKRSSYQKKRVDELLGAVDLSKRQKHKPDELSGGEQQRVAIAAALANDPPLILADEPTGELDTETGSEILDLFKSLKETYHKTEIIVTHDRRVGRIADRVLNIRDGLIVGKEEIDTQEYRKREALEAENSLLRERLDRLNAVMKQIGNELG